MVRPRLTWAAETDHYPLAKGDLYDYSHDPRRSRWPRPLAPKPLPPTAPTLRAVALVDVNEDNLATAREATGLGEKACFSSPADALQAVEADAVVVITPPDLHAGQCLEAVRAGKHVLVEKPFTPKTSAKRGRSSPRRRERGLKVAVTQNARYYPPVLTIRRLLQSGDLGQPAFGLMTKYGLAAARASFGRGPTRLLVGARHSRLRPIAPPARLRALSGSFAIASTPPWSPYSGGAAIDGWIEFHNGTTFNFQCTFRYP